MEIENSGGGWWSVERYTRLKICTVEGHEDDHGRKKKIFFWWKDLCRTCEVQNDCNWFDNRISLKLVDGKYIKFWEDKCIGKLPLKWKFPRLYSLSLDVDDVVCEMGERVIIGNVVGFNWCLHWRRDFFVWEKELEVQLLELLANSRWQKEGSERILWEDGEPTELLYCWVWLQSSRGR